jgi:sulfite exporter TauE/SafE
MHALETGTTFGRLKLADCSLLYAALITARATNNYHQLSALMKEFGL